MVAEWCGASNGRPGHQRRPGRQRAGDRVDRGHLERGLLVQRRAAGRAAARPASSCRRPGGPVRNRWCPPAAATSTARRPAAWPDHVAEVGRGAAAPAAAPGRARAGAPGRPGGRATSAEGAPRPAPRRRRPAPPRRRSPAGTTTCACPARGRGQHGRQHAADRPHRAVEPELAEQHQAVDRRPRARRPTAASTAAASARSKPLPCFGIDAGDSPMVIRRCGKLAPGVRRPRRAPGPPTGAPPRRAARRGRRAAPRRPCRPRPRPSRRAPRPGPPTRCGPASQERRPAGA